MANCVISIRKRLGLDGRYRGVDRVCDFHRHFLADPLVPLTPILQEASQPFDRVLFPPFVDLFVGPIESWVVGSGMRAVAVSHCLDECRPLAFAGPMNS